MKKFSIKKEDENQRLDVFLAGVLGISRSQAQKKIKTGEVLVNEKNETAHYQAQAGDVVVVETRYITSLQPNAKTRYTASLPPEIIHETNDYLVINKPAGLIVHGGNGIAEPTLTDWLEERYSNIRKVGDDPARPGIVHRLDKEVSGLLVIAKTNDMFDHLKKQFQNRTVKKEYTALVHGTVETRRDEINFPIARSSKGYKMAAKPTNQAGRRAVTELLVKQHFTNYTLLNIAIKTGRTHQIRVHLSAYGHPVVGDDLYGTKKTRALNEKLKFGRIFLHARQLEFYDFKNEPVKFTSKLPEELTRLLANLK